MKKFLATFLTATFVLTAVAPVNVSKVQAAPDTPPVVTADEGNGKLIVIDAGHQGRGNSSLEPIGPGASQRKPKVASGTTGRFSKVPEYKLTLVVAKKLKKELVKRGYKVKMIRTTHNVNISNSKRAKTANKLKADAFIRIHANGSTSTSINGALTMAPATGNKFMKASNVKKSQKLSSKIIKAFCKATGARSQGVMKTNSMSGINWCTVPVTIVEMGYMSNRTEDLNMQKASYQTKMVKGMANGLDAYFGF